MKMGEGCCSFARFLHEEPQRASLARFVRWPLSQAISISLALLRAFVASSHFSVKFGNGTSPRTRPRAASPRRLARCHRRLLVFRRPFSLPHWPLARRHHLSRRTHHLLLSY